MRSDQAMVIVKTASPRAFWEAFLGALANRRNVALLDPHWPGDWLLELRREAMRFSGPAPAILIPTSGSSGLPRFCVHRPDSLRAAARGFRDRFGSKGLRHAVNVLPQHHVGGLMATWRAAEAGGRVHFADYRNPDSLRQLPFPARHSTLSLVPTQLRRMLADPEATDRLHAFGMILVGGAACPPDLLASARRAELPLAPCYGSTETAAMVTALDPESFLQGVSGVGTPLPHARLETGPDQRIRIRASSLLYQYHPELPSFRRDPYLTGDLGTLDAAGRLHILGRADRVIITGGEKVHPEAVESAALATGRVQQARCRGLPDPEWGQRVELWIVPQTGQPGDLEGLLGELARHLPPWAIPKRVHPVAQLDPQPKSW